MPELWVRGAGLDWYCNGYVELEYSFLCCSGGGTDGTLGTEERAEVQKGIWRGVQKEEVCHVTRNLVNAFLWSGSITRDVFAY